MAKQRPGDAPGLLRVVRTCRDEVEDPVSGHGFSLSEYVLSGLVVFGLMSPSLLRFERDARTDETMRANPGACTGLSVRRAIRRCARPSRG